MITNKGNYIRICTRNQRVLRIRTKSYEYVYECEYTTYSRPPLPNFLFEIQR